MGENTVLTNSARSGRTAECDLETSRDRGIAFPEAEVRGKLATDDESSRWSSEVLPARSDPNMGVARQRSVFGLGDDGPRGSATTGRPEPACAFE